MLEVPLGIVPLPETAEQGRMQEQSRRRRILTGKWRRDLDHAIRVAVGTDRADAWRLPDLSSNPARQYCHAVSELYTKPPAISNEEDPGAAAIVQGALEAAGWVSRMQRLQPLTIGVREGILRVDMVGGLLRLREVDPAYVVAESKVVDGGQPAVLTEYRRREDPRTAQTDSEGRPIPGTATRTSWVRETWNSRTGTLILEDETGEDVTALHYSDTEYPYLAGDADGNLRPIMPYIYYHAHDTGTLWDSYEMCEIFEGTLLGGVYWSFFGHRLRNASWPQRYMVGLQPSGMRPSVSYPNGDGRRDTITADPAVVLSLEPMEENQAQPMIGAFPDGSDLSQYVEAVTMYDRHTIATANISKSDIQRMDGDPRSGYAISLSAAGKREAKRQFKPSFRKSDRLLCRTVARMLRGAVEMGKIEDPNRYAALPSAGYDVAYTSIGLTADEARAIVDEVSKLVGAGLLTLEEGRSKLASAGYFDDMVTAAPPVITDTGA